MTTPERFLIVGGGGREAALALMLERDTELHAVVSHANPTIVDAVERTGGKCQVGNPNDPQAVAQFAREQAIDYAFVSADAPLEAGVVDALLDAGIKTAGATREASRIEWDKVYSIDLVQSVCPEFTPHYETVVDASGLVSALNGFRERDMAVVVKPQGLTGGKGVKVMPIHLPTYDDCKEYAEHLLSSRPGESVLLVEKLEGIEFTIMGFTDGESLVMSPASYDYPFRLEGDLGPGTGGMGCFTAAGGKKLPFMSDLDWQQCETVMRRTIERLHEMGTDFNGVINGGFFKTRNGIRFMEFNGRFGDPEGLNITSIMQGSLADVIRDICHRRLTEDSVPFISQASVVKYLVAREYPEESSTATDFSVDEAGIRDMGIQVFYGACERTGNGGYRTLKKSRVMALGATADSIEAASDLVNRAVSEHVKGDLDFRADIGSRDDLLKLDKMNKALLLQ